MTIDEVRNAKPGNILRDEYGSSCTLIAIEEGEHEPYVVQNKDGVLRCTYEDMRVWYDLIQR